MTYNHQMKTQKNEANLNPFDTQKCRSGPQSAPSFVQNKAKFPNFQIKNKDCSKKLSEAKSDAISEMADKLTGFVRSSSRRRRPSFLIKKQNKANLNESLIYDRRKYETNPNIRISVSLDFLVWFDIILAVY